jgi:hypothetical protein
MFQELLKSRMSQGKPYWRNGSINEIDVIADWDAIIKPIEIKFEKTLPNKSFSVHKKWMN